MSEVDIKTQKMVAKSTNLKYKEFLQIDEIVTYEPDQTNPAKTIFKQEAQITVPISKFNNYLEEVCLNRFVANAAKGRQGLEQVLEKIILEGQLGLQHISDVVAHASSHAPS